MISLTIIFFIIFNILIYRSRQIAKENNRDIEDVILDSVLLLIGLYVSGVFSFIGVVVLISMYLP
jgi:HJR/Mrr/RecB family endonuclease